MASHAHPHWGGSLGEHLALECGGSPWESSGTLCLFILLCYAMYSWQAEIDTIHSKLLDLMKLETDHTATRLQK